MGRCFEQQAEIEQFMRTFGPGNCWTGTVGRACEYIHRLLAELEVVDAKYLKLIDELRELHERKAADYGSDEDALANLRGAVDIGIEPWRASYLRALDKVRRINTFCIKGTLANEGVRDSLMDLAAYALLTLRLFEEGQHDIRSDQATGEVVSHVATASQQTWSELMEEARKLEFE